MLDALTVTFAGPVYVNSRAAGAIDTSSIKPALNSMPRFNSLVTKAYTPDKISAVLIIVQARKPLLKRMIFLLIF